MSDYELKKMIDKVIEEKTFSLDAIKAIDDMRAANLRLEEDLKTKEEKYKELFGNASILSSDLEKANKTIIKWVERETSLLNREDKISELEKSEAVARACSQSLGQCFDSVFKNTVFRESFNRFIPSSEHGGSEAGEVIKTAE